MALFVRKYRHFFTSNIEKNQNYRLRDKDKLILPSKNLHSFENSPNSRLIRIYNKIPHEIKFEESHNKFHNKLKKLLLSKCYYSVDEFLNDKQI